MPRRPDPDAMRLHLTMSRQLYARADRIAARQGHANLSELIRRALTDYVTRQEQTLNLAPPAPPGTPPARP